MQIKKKKDFGADLVPPVRQGALYQYFQEGPFWGAFA